MELNLFYIIYLISKQDWNQLLEKDPYQLIYSYIFYIYNLKKITPALKTSQTLSYFSVLSTKFAISGATYPGVPHFGNKYLKLI